MPKINEKNETITSIDEYAEQKCKVFGCRVVRCLSKMKDSNECYQLRMELNDCITEVKRSLNNN